MRTILNYLLGKDIVSKQSNKELHEAIIEAIMCVAMGVMGILAITIFG